MYKKILILLFLALVACERKPLYFQEDVALKINVQVEANINILGRESGRDSLKYDGDESLYGKLFYTLPTTCTAVIFNNGALLSENTIHVGKSELINIELNDTYDLLIYSKEYFGTETYYEGGAYYAETKAETVNQPGEVFAMNKRKIYLSDDLSDFEEVVENGRLVYVYNIDEMLEPVSYIYVIQFIVINDDNSPIIEAKDINNFTISGISSKKNMFTNKPLYTEGKQISTFDIKPGQQHGLDSLIFASRVTILDLLPDDGGSGTSEIMYYTNIDVDTYNYGQVTGTKDITQQLRDNPKGGVITIIILNSELKRESSEEGGFGIDLNEGEQHKYDVF